LFDRVRQVTAKEAKSSTPIALFAFKENFKGALVIDYAGGLHYTA